MKQGKLQKQDSRGNPASANESAAESASNAHEQKDIACG